MGLNVDIFVSITLLYNVVYSGYPISEPFTDTGGKTVKYNMIDTDASCYHKGICPMFPPGGKLSVFPNSEEKAQHIFHNLFRMHPNYTLELSYGKWRFGANTNGGRTYFCPNCKYCGDTRTDKAPLYWYSDANQAARFKQYDEKTCDQSYYEQSGVTAHYTCDQVLDEYGGGSNCDLFGGCEFGYRATQFCEEDRCWFETEGICGGNSCYFDAHCEPIFAAKYDYQGTGFVEGTNGAATVYSRFTKEIFYPLVSGVHFDERIKIAKEDYNINGKYFTLMLEYFDHNKTQKPDVCYSIYDRGVHEMEVIVSWNGDLINGFSKDTWSVMFRSNHNPPETCQPYSFICKTTLNNYFRLPEDNSYYFGTEWIDWKWSNYSSYGQGYTCKENHYYYSEKEKLWIVNGGPTLNRKDIWYYKDTKNYGSCIGCSEIAKLECYELCILSDFKDCDGCDDIKGQIEPNDNKEGFFDDDNIIGSVAAITFAAIGCLFIVIAFVVKVFKSCSDSYKQKKIIGQNSPGITANKEQYVKTQIDNNNRNKKEYKNEGNESEKRSINNVCNDCQQSKLANEGKIDENDGLWYCGECWKRFGDVTLS